MMDLLQQSKRASGDTRPPMRGMTKSAFLALSEEEQGHLMGEFIIIKDTDVPSEFYPPSVKCFSLRVGSF
jgi:hypothetical protein